MTRSTALKVSSASPAAKTSTPTSCPMLSTREVAELIGVSDERNLRRDLRRGRFEFTCEPTSNGLQYRIALTSLPLDAQLRYWQARGVAMPSTVTPVAPTLSPSQEIEVEMSILARAPMHARKKADKYLAILNAAEGLKGHELRGFITAWNKSNPTFQTSYQRVLQARKDYSEGGVASLLARYGWRAGETAVPDAHFQFFLTLYLKEGGAPLYTCWVATMGHFGKTDATITIDNYPSHYAFQRRLEREVPLPAIVKAREGEAIYARRFGSFIERDLSAIAPGDCWISDHAQIDVMMIAPDGKFVRPWITAWRDFKSGAWLGWYVHAQAPNSDHIFHAFHLAAIEHGLPTDILIDNGKDYRSKDFAGGRKPIDEVQARSLVGALGISAHFARPYNARAKTIERDFHTQKLWFSKFMRGYTGGSVTEKPEALERDKSSGSCMRLGDFIALFDTFVKDVLNAMPSWSKVNQGLPRQAYFDAHCPARRRVSPEALALFCMRTDGNFAIGRNGIHDSKHGVTYWDERLVAMAGRTRCYLRRDPRNHLEAWVYNDATNELICKAHAIESPAALVRTEADRHTLQRETKRAATQTKIINSFTKQGVQPPPADIIAAMASGAKILTAKNAPVPAREIPEQISITKMDHAIAAEKRMQQTGKHDPAAVRPMMQPKKKKESLSLFASDLPPTKRTAS